MYEIVCEIVSECSFAWLLSGVFLLEAVDVDCVLLGEAEARVIFIFFLSLLLLLLIMHLHIAVAELTRRILTIRKGLLRPRQRIEMHLELSFIFSLFGVHFVLEIGEELLQSVDSSHETHVRHNQRRFKDSLLICFLSHFVDATVDQASNLRAHDFGHLRPDSVPHICGLLLPLPAIGDHVEEEVLEDEELEEVASVAEQVRPGLGRLVQHDVGQAVFDLFGGFGVFDCPG